MARAADETFDQSIIDNRLPSVGHLFRDRVSRSGSREAFRFPRGEDWSSLTWDQTAERAYALAAGLIDLGLEPEERVALASSTRIEWVLADLAVMVAGGATTTIYPTTLSDDVAFIIADSGSRFVIAEDAAQLAKLEERRGEIAEVAKVILIEGQSDDDWVLTLDEVEALGRTRLASEPELIDTRIDGITPEHLATIIYTSGTTARPKGVLLKHSAWTYVAASVDSVKLLSEDDLQYLWLPLAHVFGKMLVVLPLQMGFANVVDGRVDKIVENVGVVKPTFMGAAPRIFEKAYARITMMIADDGGAKEKLFNWAIGVGRKVAALRREGKKPGFALGLQYGVANKLLGKVRERFGGRIRFFISGSAALNTDVAEWFEAVGLLILEGYGLTESSAASVVNRPATASYQIGSVGWPLPGTEVKIAPDGEVLMRSPGIMSGYHNQPEATADVIDGDGWFATGDIGELDADGFLKITDRKKDLFKTSGGKYVAPSLVESQFKGICPYVSQLVVEGDGRNFVSALITLDPEAIQGWAEKNGLGDKSYAQIVTSDEARAMVQGYVDQLNEQINNWSRIRQFIILDHDLTIEDGALTPSMKLKRKVVVRRYKEQLDELYPTS